MTHQVSLMTLATVIGVGISIAGVGTEPAAATQAETQGDIVQMVGCVEHRSDASVWLTKASTPTVARRGVVDHTQVDAALTSDLGNDSFRLIGEADFLSAEGLLRTGERSAFTSPEQVNATGGLRAGRKVLIKGLLIESDNESRVNLLAVVALSDTCSP